MARTKQTARKSTGGPAPRAQICGSYQPVCYRFDYGNVPLQHAASKEGVIPNTAMVASNAEMPSDAQMKVFSTPDVLVIILSQLPHSSLLTAKRVNKAWASLFENVEIKASLFECPRPKESALYTEIYSDLLMKKFLSPWPTNGEEYENNHLGWQWRQLLICQPPVEALEVVQQIDQRGGGILEFRTIIPRPNGLRMGFLYDAIRYWHQVEQSPVELLWDRKTGDLTNSMHFYPDGPSYGPSYRTLEDKPCVTIWGKKSVDCGQSGGLTYEHYRSGRGNMDPRKLRARAIKSGDERVEFSMSEPKLVSIDLGLLFDSMEEDEENREDEDS